MFFLSRTRATIRDSLFLNGAASTAGGAFHVDRGAAVEVYNTSFLNNSVRAAPTPWLVHAVYHTSF